MCEKSTSREMVLLLGAVLQEISQDKAHGRTRSLSAAGAGRGAGVSELSNGR
jgi:hypothetical protein